jgi:polysaccharide transporter, PST family
VAVLTFYTLTNTFILGLRASPEAVAYFSAAHRVIVAFRTLVGPIATSIYPHITHKATVSETEAVAFVRRYRYIVAAPFFALSLGLYAAAPLIVALLFGPKYQESIHLMRIMVLSPFLLMLANFYTAFYMLPFGYEKQWRNMIVAAAALNFAVLAPLLLTVRATTAVAITTTVVDVFNLVISWWFFSAKSHFAGARDPVPHRR